MTTATLPPPTATVPPLAAVRAFLAAHDGRRFGPEDVTPALYEAATQYALAYDSDFDFMIEMRQAARTRRGLSVGQAKGVLNCAKAQVEREDRAAAQAARATRPAGGPDPDRLGPTPLVQGIYIVSFPSGEQARVRVKPLDAAHCTRYGVPLGTVKYGVYAGGDTDGSYQWLGLVSDNAISRRWRVRYDEMTHAAGAQVRAQAALAEPALRVLAQSASAQYEAGMAFSEAAGECFRCSKTLLTDESRQRGIGPECWRREGARQAA